MDGKIQQGAGGTYSADGETELEKEINTEVTMFEMEYPETKFSKLLRQALRELIRLRHVTQTPILNVGALRRLGKAIPPVEGEEPSIEWYCFDLHLKLTEALNSMQTTCEIPMKLEHSNTDTSVELATMSVDAGFEDVTYDGTREVLTFSWRKQ